MAENETSGRKNKAKEGSERSKASASESLGAARKGSGPLGWMLSFSVKTAESLLVGFQQS